MTRAPTAGARCLTGAVIGAAGGILLAAVPPAVSPDRFSYPLTATGHRVAETVIVINHLLLLAGVVGLWRARVADTRAGRAGLRLAGLGLTMLTGCEIGAFLLADSAQPTVRTDQLGIAYGISNLAVGIGLVVAGIAAERARVLTGWTRHAVLACGAGLFVIVLPAFATGSMAAARLGIAAWMLLWAAIGYALIRLPQTVAVRS